MEHYLQLKTNLVDAYGQPIKNELFIEQAAREFLEKTKINPLNFEFCLNYLLKKCNKEHLDNTFLALYDNYAKPTAENCEPLLTILPYLAEKADKLNKVSVGTKAPDFSIMDEKLNLYQLPSDFTLLVFWASWCPHCVEELPTLKKVVDEAQKNGKNIMVVAISLDTDQKQWQQFVEQNQLSTWVNISDFKSWNGTIPKRYNIYATPTLFLLDKDKKIIAKLETVQQLKNTL